MQLVKDVLGRSHNVWFFMEKLLVFNDFIKIIIIGATFIIGIACNISTEVFFQIFKKVTEDQDWTFQ